MTNGFSGKMKKLLLAFAVVIWGMTVGAVSTQAATTLTGGESKEAAVQMNVAGDLSDASIEASKVVTTLNGERWFKFTTSNRDSFYRVYMKNISVQNTNYGQKGLNVALYTEAGEQLWNANQIRENCESYVYLDLSPNTVYYLMCDPAVDGGNAYLSVAESVDDVKDTQSEAAPISLNQEYIYGLQGSSDVDYFYFTTTGNNSYYQIDCANISVAKPSYNYAMDIYLLTQDGEQVAQFYKLGTASECYKLASNATYYIKVSTRANLGNYKFKVTEIVDNAPDAMTTAKSLDLGELENGSFEVNGDVDWFKFKTNAAGNYVISTKNINVRYYRFDVYNVYEEDLWGSSCGTGTTSFVLKLDANTEYYIRCRSSSNYTGNYTVSATSASISEAKVKLSKDSYTYNGKERKPSVTVTMNQVTLVEGTDYTVSYSNNTKVGTAKVKITGKGNYEGTQTKKFKITKANMSDVTVSKVSNQTYTGKNIKPSVTVKLGSKKLKKDTDYTISYSNNKNMGTATIKIKAKGNNLTGSKKITFKIVPKKVTISKAENSGSKKAKITWKKDSSVTGYEVYRSTKKNSGYKLVTTIKKNKTTSYTDKNLTKNKTYYYKVRAYKTVNGKKVYGSYSSVKTVKIKK